MKIFYIIPFLLLSLHAFSQDKKCCLKGDSLLTSTEYKAAIYEYTKILHNNPVCSRAYYGRGMSKFYLIDHRGSLQDLSEYVKSKKGNEYGTKDDQVLIYTIQMAYITMGKSYLILKDKDAACISFSRAGEFGSKEVYDLIKEHCQ